MEIFIGLGVAGFMLVLLFFTKLSSFDPKVKAAIIGVRIILFLGVIFASWSWHSEQKSKGRDFFGNLTIEPDDFIGQWRTSFTKAAGQPFSSIYSFYKDSTFNSSTDKAKGKWLYIPKTEKLYLHFPDGSNEFIIKTFDGITITASAHDRFIKLRRCWGIIFG